MFSSSEPIKAEIKNTKMKTSISMRDFFALAEVIALQEIQKRNAYGSKAHREAFDDMKALAATYGAASYLGEY
jgi:predicted xylose isomerase-like sugar epimerase